MIEKSVYENYEIDFSDSYTSDDAYYFIFNDERELYLTDDKTLPSSFENTNTDFKLYIGKYKNKDTFIINTNSDKSFFSLKEVYDIDKDIYLMATRAVLVRDWYIQHQFCGRCATATVLDEKDMMLKCPSCGQMHYPRIAPAIIVAIRKGDELLMAKHSYHENIRYALIAGFVEPGESIEEAVHREVLEEIGIKIKNLKYQKSQSWPFPNSLMLGFTAEYDSGEIKVDGDEILKAKWFKKDEIIRYDSDISISDWLIQSFIDDC
ncbi:MAG: NAD(+) diphosphatase [Methanobrevibacter sp.]|uniref:NAD(+) diphosphatase n=1 Tax=Methanobrevibacter sp. TaxID=66852 RepID=UPI0025FE0B22|nr:NAD(+) diphosphatase [Methanobrevibacter sp.]MBQ6098570.1 NAD(+) diphosphatase [Methanobrevibacter sp.]